jgi:hypothetical protein
MGPPFTKTLGSMNVIRLASFSAVILCAVLLRSPAVAQDLCSPTKPPVELGQGAVVSQSEAQGESPEAMSEHDFDFEKAMEAMAWLRDGVWEYIKKSKTIVELKSISSGFPFRHHNNTEVAKGALLKQQALLERERLEVETLKLKVGSGTRAQVGSAQRRYGAARDAFCKFLSEAGWAD